MQVTKQQVPFCPACGERPVRLRFRRATGERERAAGAFLACECGALTEGRDGSHRNLRTAEALEVGLSRMMAESVRTERAWRLPRVRKRM